MFKERNQIENVSKSYKTAQNNSCIHLELHGIIIYDNAILKHVWIAQSNLIY